MRPRTRTAAAAVALAAALGVAIPASATASARIAPAQPGVIHLTDVIVFNGRAVLGVTNLNGHDAITGAFADRGYSTTPKSSSFIETLHLTHGTIVVNLAPYYHDAVTTYPGGKATCSDSGTFSAAKLPVLRGTGAYAHAHGTLIVKGTFADISAATPKGCSTTVDTSVIQITYATGRISFSS